MDRRKIVKNLQKTAGFPQQQVEQAGAACGTSNRRPHRRPDSPVYIWTTLGRFRSTPARLPLLPASRNRKLDKKNNPPPVGGGLFENLAFHSGKPIGFKIVITIDRFKIPSFSVKFLNFYRLSHISTRHIVDQRVAFVSGRRLEPHSQNIATNLSSRETTLRICLSDLCCWSVTHVSLSTSSVLPTW